VPALRTRLVEQLHKAVFHAGHGLCEIDFPAPFATCLRLIDHRLQQILHQQDQVFHQLGGMEVLFDSQRRAAAEIVQLKGDLGTPKVGFDAPAAVVEPGKLLNRVGLRIQQRGQQQFCFTGFQLNPDDAQTQGQVGICARFAAHQT
jgi:hypothetical protein